MYEIDHYNLKLVITEKSVGLNTYTAANHEVQVTLEDGSDE